MRVLVIEDNADLGRLLGEALKRRSIASDWARNLADAGACLAAHIYDAIVLDLGLPDGDGLEWLSDVPAGAPPVLVLTARGTLKERVSGLDRGADDYLVKPAPVEEIAARLRALVRRPGRRGSQTLHVGALELQVASKSVTFQNRPVIFSPRELAFVERLMQRPGQVIVREVLEADLYGVSEAVTPNALEAVASRVRRRLNELGAPDMIHTVRGVGYFIQADDPETRR